MARDSSSIGVAPSEYTKQLRPDQFSDTRSSSAYKLDAAVFEHRLETIVAVSRLNE